jgi:hypothetical protein
MIGLQFLEKIGLKFLSPGGEATKTGGRHEPRGNGWTNRGLPPAARKNALARHALLAIARRWLIAAGLLASLFAGTATASGSAGDSWQEEVL